MVRRRHTLSARRDGDGREAAKVEGGHARAAALGGATVSAGLELARGRPLRVEVHGPKGEVGEEVVPPQLPHAPQLLAHGFVASRQRDQVRHEHGLQFYVGVEARPLEQVGHEVLIWVVGQALTQVG